MTALSWVTYSLLLLTFAQCLLARILDRAKFINDLFTGIVRVRTRSFKMDGIEDFFHENGIGNVRVEHIARISMLAAAAVAQLSSLISVFVACLTLALVAIVGGYGPGWSIATGGVAILVALATLTLLNRVRTRRFRDFTLSKPSRREWASTPGFYLVVVSGASIWVGVIGSLFDAFEQ